jgi:LexA-binding, inner membrane-associated putative hydrolase
MSPVTHFLSGWVLAAVAPSPLARREKALIVAAAVAPDIDGLGLLPELLTRHSSHPLLWFSQYHHRLHTLSFAVACALLAFLLAGRLAYFTFGPAIQGRRMPSHPALTSLLVFLGFHLHLLCDLVGSRGPDGDPWPIPYLRPFSNALQLTWHNQWALNGWQNFTFTGLLLLATLWIAWKRESSPLELFSDSANRALVQALRQRFSSRADKASAG